ncbi:type II secretion system F family protein [Planctomycetota bacterium]
MAVFSYQAHDEKGNRFSGTYRDISSVRALRCELDKVGYILDKAQRKRAVKLDPRKVQDKEIVGFAYQFAGMYAAGLSVLHCLETLEEQTPNKVFKSILADIRESVETGASLKKSFARHTAVFSNFFIGMIEAGETGAKLAEALEMSARHLEKRAELRERLKSAFIYPAIVSVVSVLVIGSLLTFVVPMFSKLYTRLHVDLPGPTRILMMLSRNLREGWIVGLILLTLVVWGGQWLLKRPRVRALTDRLKLRLPFFGPLNRLVTVSRFIRTFATLVTVGVSLIEAIEVARAVADNDEMDEISQRLQDSIRAGNPVAGALQEHPIFPTMVVRLADSGEQAGVIDEMLHKAADFLDKEIDRIINSMLIKLEPILTLGLGGLIGLMLLGVYLPMFDYMNQIR